VASRKGSREKATPAPAAGKGGLAAAAALSAAGLVIAIVLTRLHAQAHAGVASFCAIDDTVNCDKVATSAYSVVLGLPVSIWGVLGYAVMLALALWGLARRGPHPAWPSGLLLATAAGAVAASVALAYVSKVLIGAWCILCIASWVAAAGVLVAAIAAVRPVGAGAALRADLAAVRASPGKVGAAAALLAAGVAATAYAYPRYWERKAQPPAPDAATAPATATAPRTGPVVVVEFSDYECPYCALMHERSKPLLLGRKDVVFEKRHFPLDQACNPLVTRPFHQRACGLALAAICAEQQGKLHEMDDALFANQQLKDPLETVAARVGLGLGRFASCLQDPATRRRLDADVQAGLRAGVKATPTYLVDGQVFSGQFPAHLLPPRPAAAGAR
jgi:protein-disulfide isomerase